MPNARLAGELRGSLASLPDAIKGPGEDIANDSAGDRGPMPVDTRGVGKPAISAIPRVGLGKLAARSRKVETSAV